METDRELLENAAKAAGYVIRDSTRWKNTVVCQVTLDDGSTNYVRWNPLTDDGDEARLEGALGLGVLWGSRTVTVGRKHFGPFEERFQEHNGDKQAARRRAGVRAAAEIGKSINGTSF